MISLPLLRDQKDLAGKRALVRLDLNVPIADGVVIDDFRIRKSLETLQFLREQGARIVVLSHHSDGDQSLAPIEEAVQAHLPATFIGDLLAKDPEHLFDGVEAGTVLVAEN